jgi:putative hemolysin
LAVAAFGTVEGEGVEGMEEGSLAFKEQEGDGSVKYCSIQGKRNNEEQAYPRP